MEFFLMQLIIVLIPIILLFIGAWFWVQYKNTEFVSKMEWVTLEINIPKEVSKSPVAMELFLHSLMQGKVSHWYDKYFMGRVSQWFSLEIASIEGNIYFFIRTTKRYKDLVESQVYAQFPQAEIHEVDDYTKYVPKYNPKSKEWDLWGCEYILAKDDAYPIKTYVDYGLDKDVNLKEFQKSDPLSAVLEFMGSMRKGEQLWLQFLVRGSESDWRKQGEKEIEKIMKRDKKDEKKDDKPVFPQPLTPVEKTKVEAIERSLSKQAFDVGIRAVYIFKKDAFRLGNIFGLLGFMRPFNHETLNGFKPKNGTGYIYPWQDFRKIREKRARRIMFSAYINREYFGMRGRKHFVLTTEELATIFRFPGRVTETPSLERIEAVKSEPPVNLPI